MANTTAYGVAFHIQGILFNGQMDKAWVKHTGKNQGYNERDCFEYDKRREEGILQSVNRRMEE